MVVKGSYGAPCSLLSSSVRRNGKLIDIISASRVIGLIIPMNIAFWSAMYGLFKCA